MRWALLFLIACKHESTLTWLDVHLAVPGASSEQMAATTAVLETKLAALAGVATVRSESTSGLTSIFIGATGDVTAPVHDAVEGARRSLPEETMFPTVERRRPLVARLTVPVDRGEATARKIEMLDGITRVERCDGSDAPVRYALDTARLAAKGATVSDALDAARSQPQTFQVMVANDLNLESVITKLPSLPACRATTRDGEVALLEVYGEHLASLGGFGTVLPPLIEVDGDTGDVVIARAGAPRRVLVPAANAAVLTITATDPTLLATAATAIVAKVGALQVRGLASIGEKVVEIDRARAAELGVDVSIIAQTLALASDDGVEISAFRHEGPERRLVAKGPLLVRSTKLGTVPLEYVSRITEHTALREVLRVDGQRAVTVLAREEVDVGALPAGVTATWSRTIER